MLFYFTISLALFYGQFFFSFSLKRLCAFFSMNLLSIFFCTKLDIVIVLSVIYWLTSQIHLTSNDKLSLVRIVFFSFGGNQTACNFLCDELVSVGTVWRVLSTPTLTSQERKQVKQYPQEEYLLSLYCIFSRGRIQKSLCDGN